VNRLRFIRPSPLRVADSTQIWQSFSGSGQDEFSFRYNNRTRLGIGDAERAVLAAKGMDAKRLTYRRIGEA
jgi:hypothetical protein